MGKYADTELVEFFQYQFENWRHDFIDELISTYNGAINNIIFDIGDDIQTLYDACIDQFYKYETLWYSRRSGGEPDSHHNNGDVGVGTGTGENLYGLLTWDYALDTFTIGEKQFDIINRINFEFIYYAMCDPMWLGRGVPDNEKILNMIVEDGKRFKNMTYSISVSITLPLLKDFSASGSISDIFAEYGDQISQYVFEYLVDEIFKEFDWI